MTEIGSTSANGDTQGATGRRGLNGKEIRLLIAGLIIGGLAVGVGVLARGDGAQEVVAGPAERVDEPGVEAESDLDQLLTAVPTITPAVAATPTSAVEASLSDDSSESDVTQPPVPTVVSSPTITPRATATPQATATPRATATPASTPTTAPTVTPPPTPTSLPTVTPEPTSTPAPVWFIPNSYLQAVLADIVSRAGGSVDDLQVLSVSDGIFPSGALGCDNPRIVAVQVESYGYVVTVALGSNVYDYRVSEGGGFFICRDPFAGD